MPQMSPSSLHRAVATPPSPRSGPTHVGGGLGSASALSPEARRWVQHYTERGRALSAQQAMHAHQQAARQQAGAELYVSAEELRQADDAADAAIRAVRIAVSACTKLSDADRATWDAFETRWNTQHAQNQDIINSTFSLGAGDARAATLTLQGEAARMRDRVAGACSNVISPSGALPGSSSTWVTAVIVVAVVGAVIAGLWFLSPLIMAASRRKETTPQLPPHA